MEKTFYKRDTCRLCDSKNLKEVLKLADTPLCDAYIPRSRLNQAQEVYPLSLSLCSDCGYVFLPYVVSPEIIYKDYLYVTSSSLGLSNHFESYAQSIIERIKPSSGSLAIDIGSNDGILLRFLKERGMRVLGVEPALEIAKEATESGVQTLGDFFTKEVPARIKADYGLAKVITINNLYANVDDLEEFTENICSLLDPEGVLIIESFYLADLIDNMVFDFIYHEHLSYFSVKPISKFLERFNMVLADVEHISTKGGSMRYYFYPKTNPKPITSRVSEMITFEEKLGLNKPETFDVFSRKIDKLKNSLRKQIDELKAQNKTLAGYGASATSTTLIYHFGLGEDLDFIVDDNPAKINTFSPGYHIPVISSQTLYEKKPDIVLTLAWRYSGHLAEKHKAFLGKGGKFIIPLPKLEEIPASRPWKVPYRDLSIKDSVLKKELLASVEKVLSHGRIILGPEVTEFESQISSFCKRRYAVGMNSGTDALYLALRSLGISYGDEVITTPLSWIATLNAITLTGAKPVFIDIADDLNINPDLIESAITSKTKAILPVHFTGKICDMEKIIAIAHKHKLFVVEDAAQAFGARRDGIGAGSFGNIGAFSMNPMKVLCGYGEAGAVVTDDKDIYDRLVSLRYAGTVNKEDCHFPSLNGRLDTIQAAMLLVNLKYLKAKIKRTQKIAQKYTEALGDTVGCPGDDETSNVYYSYTITTPRRDELMSYLESKGIETKIQHPILMPYHTAYKGSYQSHIPNAQRLVNQILCIPNEETLEPEQADYVINSIKEFFAK